jgi:glycosyltransferase involved in cell wall biosynthesis
MKQLLAITDPGCPASQRYRVTQFDDYFQRHGVQIRAIPCPQDKDEIARLLQAVQQADVVVIQRILPRSALLRQLRRCARRLVFDFDDAVIYGDSAHHKPRVKLRRWWRFRQMMLDCDAITAGNTYLAGLAGIHADRRRVFTVPTVVEVERYEREPAPGRTPSALGWIGGRWTLPYLEQLRRPLEKLSVTHPGLVVQVIADRPPDLGKVSVSLAPWHEATEVRDLKALRAGLAPLPDDAWTRGKCALRLLQYLAAGIPAVAAPVGTQADIIRLGAALPAEDDDGWRSGIHRLLTDPGAVAGLVARGREIVREHYSLETWSPRLLAIWCAGNGA